MNSISTPRGPSLDQNVLAQNTIRHAAMPFFSLQSAARLATIVFVVAFQNASDLMYVNSPYLIQAGGNPQAIQAPQGS
jgi:hypothetical protein